MSHEFHLPTQQTPANDHLSFACQLISRAGVPQSFPHRKLLCDLVDSSIDHQIVTYLLGPVTVEALKKCANGDPAVVLIDAGDIRLLILFDASRAMAPSFTQIGWECVAACAGYTILRIEDPAGFKGSALVTQTQQQLAAS